MFELLFGLHVGIKISCAGLVFSFVFIIGERIVCDVSKGD